MSNEPTREPFHGRYHGIFNVDGNSPAPVAMFRSKDHQVFPCDVVGAWWNSYDDDPRALSPLSSQETIAAYTGDPS